jgi:hypothetical protein
VKKCLDFARKWGYPFDYSPQDGSIENGPGVVGHRFQSFGWGPSVLDVTFRGSFTVSNVFLSDEEVSGSGPYVIIPAEGNAWTQRATTE